jgi:hypothetical protein
LKGTPQDGDTQGVKVHARLQDPPFLAILKLLPKFPELVKKHFLELIHEG